MHEEIQGRLEQNLERVRGLIDTYAQQAGRGRGRRSVATSDLLRAAVVFLHATMEDVLRSVLLLKWPGATAAEHFEGVPISVHGHPRDKVKLVELLALRGMTVDEVIQQSVEAYLALSSFNHLGQVKTALKRSGIDPAAVLDEESTLATMMSRRHQIVHRADRVELGGSGKHAAASLSQPAVDEWLAAVESFCRAVIANL